PVPVSVKGLGLAYCFSFAGVRATKRPRTPELEGAPSEEKAPEQKPMAETKVATDVAAKSAKAKAAKGGPDPTSAV
ncbi:MAG TPA: hypothetical protein VK191_17915, partial [Symbiobacteriaceae bacterium]|nr:hypothetical protein [Symbiobacteriaceae bacterium]